MLGEIGGLGAAFCWALSSILSKALSRKFAPLTLNFWRCAGAAVALWAAIPFFPGVQSLFSAPRDPVIFLILSAVMGISVGDTIYFRGLKLIRVTLAFPIGQTSMPLMTILAAVLFLGEKITWTMGLGTAFILIGISLNAVSPERGRPQVSFSEHKAGGIALVILAAAFWALSVSFLKVGLQGLDFVSANGVRLPVAAMALLTVILFQKPLPAEERANFRSIGLAAVSGVLSFGVGGILFLMSIHYAGAGKAAVLTSCAPLFGLPLSVWLLRERVTGKAVAGIALASLGIILVI